MGMLVINEDTLDVSTESEVYVYLKNSKCKAKSKTIHKLFLFVTVLEAALF